MTAAEAKTNTDAAIAAYQIETEDLYAVSLAAIYASITEATTDRKYSIIVSYEPSDEYDRIIKLLLSQGYKVERVRGLRRTHKIEISWA